MTYKNILILGAGGEAGKRIASLFISYTKSNLLLSDIDKLKCDEVNNNILNSYKERCCSIYLDVSNKFLLEKYTKDVDLIIIASSTIKYIKNILDSALKNKCNIIDIQGPSIYKSSYIDSYDSVFRQQGLYIISEAGAWPGLPLTMINHCTQYFDRITSIEILGFYNVDWNEITYHQNTIIESNSFYKENDNFPAIFCDNEWKIPLDSSNRIFSIDNIDIDFKPTYTTELKNILNKYQHLNKFGFYTNFGDDRLEEITLFRCVIQGEKSNKHKKIQLEISSKKGYDITASAVLSIFNIKNINSGVYYMGNLDSNKIFETFKKLNIKVDLK